MARRAHGCNMAGVPHTREPVVGHPQPRESAVEEIAGLASEEDIDQQSGNRRRAGNDEDGGRQDQDQEQEGTPGQGAFPPDDLNTAAQAPASGRDTGQLSGGTRDPGEENNDTEGSASVGRRVVDIAVDMTSETSN